MSTELNMAQSNAAMTLAEALHRIRQDVASKPIDDVKKRAVLAEHIGKAIIEWQREGAADFTEFSSRDLALMVTRGILYSEFWMDNE